VLSKEALDLAFKLLSLDPERRPTAAEALQHPYFTKELPQPERPTGYADSVSCADGSLVKMDGEWHEFESKQRKRAQRAQNQERSRTAPSTSLKTQAEVLGAEKVGNA
jgi:CTD kinase subunit alpha